MATLRQDAGALGCREHMSSASCSQPVAPSVIWIIPLDAWNGGFLLHTSVSGLRSKGDIPPLLICTLVPLYHRRNMIKEDKLVLGKEGSEFYISALVLI